MVTGGITGFWIERTRNAWVNQIFFDLLLAIGASWYFIRPQAKDLEMNRPLWLVFILCSRGIGLLAMIARLLYLKENKGQSA